MASIGTLVSTQTIIARTAGALFGIELGSTSMNSLAAAAGSTTASQTAFLNTLYANSVGVNTANSTVVTVVMTNLGIPTTDTAVYTGVSAYLQAQLDGAAYTARGGVLNDFLTLFSTLTASSYVTAFNTKISAAETYAATTASNASFTSISTTPSTVGSTFTLTSTVDVLTGTSNDDTFIGDTNSVSAADQITGGSGTDTLKLYSLTVAQQAALPAISGVEKLFLSAQVAAGTVDVSTISDLTSVQLDNQAGGETVKVTTGQSVILSGNAAATNTTTISGNTPTSLSVTLNNIGQTTGATDTVDFSGTALATVNFTTTGTKSAITLTDTGAKITKLTVAGDKGLAITENAATAAAILTVDGSTSTGGVKLDKTAGAAGATFAFTGGTGDDILILKAGDLAALSAGSQIAMGGGTDKVGIFDLTAALTAPVLAKINAITGVEVLGLNAAQAIDASQLTSIKTFSLDTDAIQSITKMVTGSEVKVTAAHTATFASAGDVGVSDLKLTIGQAASNTEAATAGLNNTGVFTIGQTSVALASNGTNAAANQVTVANADNSVYTITGSNDLTLTLGSVAPTAIGSKVDGSAFTGKLVVTGNTKAFSSGSSLGDTLIGGSGADTIKAAVNGGTLTGNGGADTFDVSVALGGVTATFNTTTITDFTKGDKIKFINTGTSAFTSAKVDLSGAASVGAALDLLAAGAGNVNGIVKWGNYGGNTYIVNDNTAGATFAATDIMVKLTGTLDLSTSTYATDTLTFA